MINMRSSSANLEIDTIQEVLHPGLAVFDGVHFPQERFLRLISHQVDTWSVN